MHKDYLYVGIDVSLKTLVTCILDTSGTTILKPKTFANIPNGVDSLLAIVNTFAANFDNPCILLGVESTSVYANHLLYSIADSDYAKTLDLHSFCFKPNMIQDFRKSMGDLPKNDKSDSYVIASKLRAGNLPSECYINFKQLGLQRLTRFSHHLTQSIAQEKTYMVSNLFLKFSTLSQEKILSDNFGATAEALLTEVNSTEDIANMSLEELVNFVSTVSKNRFDDIHQTAENIKQAASSSFKLNKSINDSLSIVIKSCYDNISSLEKAKRHIDVAIAKQVKELFANEYLVLTSIPGIGPTIAARHYCRNR